MNKIHKKLYKAKKQWCCAAIVALGVFVGLGSVSYADTVGTTNDSAVQTTSVDASNQQDQSQDVVAQNDTLAKSTTINTNTEKITVVLPVLQAPRKVLLRLIMPPRLMAGMQMKRLIIRMVKKLPIIMFQLVMAQLVIC